MILCKSLGDKALLASLGVTTDAGIGGKMKGCSFNTEQKQTGRFQPSPLSLSSSTTAFYSKKVLSFAKTQYVIDSTHSRHIILDIYLILPLFYETFLLPA